MASGFELWAVIAEYRALRASVLRLWRESGPTPDLRDLDDLTRFNESIDQSLTHAVRSYAEQVERDRETLLANEQASRTGSRSRQPRQGHVSGHAQPRDAHAAQRHRRVAQHLASRGCRQDSIFRRDSTVIERNTKAQVQLIDDVLDVSRIVSGKLRVEISSLRIDRRHQRRRERGAPGGGGARHHVGRAARSVGQPHVVRCRANSAGRLEPGLERREVHAQGRTSRRHAEPRAVQYSDSGQRQRTGDQCRAVAAHLRPLPPGRQQHAAEIRRAGAGAFHRQVHRGSAWRDGRSRQRGRRQGLDVHRPPAHPRGADRRRRSRGGDGKQSWRE